MPKIILEKEKKKNEREVIKPDGRKIFIRPKAFKMTEHIRNILEFAFLEGHTDQEASLIAGIHPATLYRYIKDHPEFDERKNLLKNNPIIKARQTLNRALETNPDIAFKFLERKKRDEFGLKTEIDVTSQGSRIVAFNYLPPIEIEGELLDEPDNNTDKKTTPSLSDTTGQDY